MSRILIFSLALLMEYFGLQLVCNILNRLASSRVFLWLSEAELPDFQAVTIFPLLTATAGLLIRLMLRPPGPISSFTSSKTSTIPLTTSNVIAISLPGTGCTSYLAGSDLTSIVPSSSLGGGRLAESNKPVKQTQANQTSQENMAQLLVGQLSFDMDSFHLLFGLKGDACSSSPDTAVATTTKSDYKASSLATTSSKILTSSACNTLAGVFTLAKCRPAVLSIVSLFPSSSHLKNRFFA
ncbi:unnamed protein product [Protopolystoma xenopodis]|uniref:Uncharacterized protein n=1 Tax=Protopolystoma xenopodis TaxID=117903 RepID=A0A3S5BXA9_9PLAT|nr:unnamed protein product [Protopolystoma xenopodis]